MRKSLLTVGMIASLLSACSDIYYDRRETVALGADDHIASNMALQMIESLAALRRQQESRLQRRANAGSGRVLPA